MSVWVEFFISSRNTAFPIKVSQLLNQSHYRPVQALRVPEGWSSQILKQSAHEGGKVVRPMQRPPLPPHKIFLVLVSVGGTRWCSWLRHCATNRKVAESNPDGVIRNFHWHKPSGRPMALGWTHGTKGGRCVVLIILPPTGADFLNIWEP
jgi:hypothetical protein